MFKLQLIIIFITISLASSINNLETINFLKDFLLALHQPVRIVCLLCWKRSEKLLLFKILNEDNYQMTVHDLKVNDDILFHRNIDNYQLLIVTDAKCNDHENVLKKANEVNLFRYPYKWLIFNFINIPNDLNVTINSRIYVTNTIDEDMLEMKLIYKIHERYDSFIEENVGIWLKSGFFYFKPEIFGKERTNLRGHSFTFTMVIIYNDSMLHLTDYRNSHTDPVGKLSYILSLYVANILNVTTRHLRTDTWGYKSKLDGTFTGMLGHLHYNVADIAITPMFLTNERLDFIDYIADIANVRLLFFFREPPLSYVENVYTLPFNISVWIVCFILMIVTLFLLYIIVNCERKHLNYKNDIDSQMITLLQPKVPDIILFEVGALCQQGVESEPRSNAGRILTICNFIFITFLYISYGAFIVALFQSTANNLKSVKDLLYSNIKLGVVNQPYNIYYFTNEKEPLRKALYDKKILSDGKIKTLYETMDGMRKTRDEFFALHVDTASAYRAVSDIYDEHQKCTFQEIDVWGFKNNPWISVPKKSPYKKLFTISYLKLKQYGIQQREYRKLFSQKPKCTHGRNIFKIIELIDCYHVFLVLGVGITIALLLLLAEIIFVKFKTGKLHNGPLN